MLAGFDLTLEKIVANPRAYPRKIGQARRVIVGKLPFVVFFLVAERWNALLEEDEEVILVLRFLHQRQDHQKALGEVRLEPS